MSLQGAAWEQTSAASARSRGADQELPSLSLLPLPLLLLTTGGDSDVSSHQQADSDEWVNLETNEGMTDHQNPQVQERFRVSSQEDESGCPYPNPREAMVVAARPPASKQTRKKALTGDLADFPTLGLTLSADPAMNMGYVLMSRILVHKWKVFLMGLRVQEAFAHSQSLAWRRNPRWLAGLLGTETASIWGHLGSATRSLRGKDGPPLFR